MNTTVTDRLIEGESRLMQVTLYSLRVVIYNHVFVDTEIRESMNK